MKILMFPGSSTAQNNIYIDILVEYIQQEGLAVEDWNKYKPFQTADVFHIHWPELLVWLRNRRFRRLEGDYFIWNFFDTIRRIKRSNGIVVWTVHNLEPHDKHIREDDIYKNIIERLISSIDAFFVLTEKGIPEILKSFPSLSSVPFFKTQHPSYSSTLEHSPLDKVIREKHGLGGKKKVFSLLGNLRPNKKADLAVRVFSNLNPTEFHLLLGGNASTSYRHEIDQLIDNSENITADYGILTDEKITEYYSISNATVFPSSDYFNSGTIYTALSLNIPVIAARTPTNEEIQEKVGSKWLYLFDGEFSERVVIEASSLIASRKDGEICDMNYFSPQKAAQSILNGYQAILSNCYFNKRK
jgi:hypothetical protein